VYNVRLFQVAILISLFLSHSLGRFCSVCSEATFQVPNS